jgi:crotonobetainyl-CoA:carnitine CoA-transferase CaiB-like acyl-CoA transferase
MTQDALLQRTSREWIDRLNEYDVPHAPVMTRSEMIRHPQIQANKLIVEHDHPDAGPLRQTRTPARFDGTPAEYRMGGPRLGQHTSQVLSEAGFSDVEIAALLEDGAAIAEK